MERYKILRRIGRGSYGSVFLAEDVYDEDRQRYVIKAVDMGAMSEREKEQAVREAAFLHGLRHPNVVKYQGAGSLWAVGLMRTGIRGIELSKTRHLPLLRLTDAFEVDNVLHIVMEYCEAGDLASRIKDVRSQDGDGFSETDIMDWFAQLVLAVDYIHSQRVLHRDLKTQNVFLTRRNIVKIGDFGIARLLEHTESNAETVVGTPFYMSPEVCENKPYDRKSDIWALGCILYELCTLQHAFDARNLLGLVFKIVSEEASPIPDRFSPALRELVHDLLRKDPTERPSAARVLSRPLVQEALLRLKQRSGTAGQRIRAPLTASERQEQRKRMEADRRAAELAEFARHSRAENQAAADRAKRAAFEPSADLPLPGRRPHTGPEGGTGARPGSEGGVRSRVGGATGGALGGGPGHLRIPTMEEMRASAAAAEAAEEGKTPRAEAEAEPFFLNRAGRSRSDVDVWRTRPFSPSWREPEGPVEGHRTKTVLDPTGWGHASPPRREVHLDARERPTDQLPPHPADDRPIRSRGEYLLPADGDPAAFPAAHSTGKPAHQRLFSFADEESAPDFRSAPEEDPHDRHHPHVPSDLIPPLRDPETTTNTDLPSPVLSGELPSRSRHVGTEDEPDILLRSRSSESDVVNQRSPFFSDRHPTGEGAGRVQEEGGEEEYESDFEDMYQSDEFESEESDQPPPEPGTPKRHPSRKRGASGSAYRGWQRRTRAEEVNEVQALAEAALQRQEGPMSAAASPFSEGSPAAGAGGMGSAPNSREGSVVTAESREERRLPSPGVSAADRKRVAVDHTKQECRAALGPLLFDRVYRFLSQRLRQGREPTRGDLEKLRELVNHDKRQFDACMRVQTMIYLEDQLREFAGDADHRREGAEEVVEDEGALPSRRVGGGALGTRQLSAENASVVSRPVSGRRRAHVQRRAVALPTPTNRPRSRDQRSAR